MVDGIPSPPPGLLSRPHVALVGVQVVDRPGCQPPIVFARQTDGEGADDDAGQALLHREHVIERSVPGIGPQQVVGRRIDEASGNAETIRRAADAAAPPEIDLRGTAGDVFPRMLAQAYALAAMPDEALACLKVAVDRGFINYPFLANHDPFFESIRTLPVFQELLAVVRDRWQGFEPV